MSAAETNEQPKSEGDRRPLSDRLWVLGTRGGSRRPDAGIARPPLAQLTFNDIAAAFSVEEPPDAQ